MFYLLLFLLPLFSIANGLAVLSIDVGSESLKIAIVSPGKPMEIILNTDSQRKTPLVVAFRDGDRLFGEAAVTTSVRFPEKVFMHFLDLIGKDLNSPIVKQYLTRFPYHKISVDKEKSTLLLHHPDGMSFSPEELLAMIIQKAKSDAELAAGDGLSIKDAVITVPPFFNQAERRSLIRSVEIAGLKLLQLINTNTAVALNYGVFRRKDFNDTANYILFFEMGASSTVATVAAYQTVKTKERGFVETNPQLSIKGVGFDRNLGGLEMQIRLRDYLAKLFVDQSKLDRSKLDSNHRAIAKLFKEAGRVKKVLSANSEHKAAVENVMNDIDFRAPLKRSDLEDLWDDLLGDRLTKPIKTALESAGISREQLDQVILFGGNTRVPKVQQILLDYLKISDLSKSVNADEAAALGAAYQAAYLSKGFKVKTFIVKDANLYPIQVDFSRDVESEDGSKVTRAMHRTLFQRNNHFPSKKVLTFSRHADDFEFSVNYGDLKSFLTKEEIEAFGSFNITQVKVKGVADSLSKNNEENKEYKGTRAHFKITESGLLILDGVETVFEAKVEEMVNSSEEPSTVGEALAKLGNTVRKLFSGGGDNDTKVNASETGDTSSSEKVEKQQNASSSDQQASNATDNKPKIEIKIKTIKDPLKTEIQYLDQSVIESTDVDLSIKKLDDLNKKDAEKIRKDGLKNSLETFIIETRDRLLDDEYISASTEDERNKIMTVLNEASEWLDYESSTAAPQAIQDKLHNLMVTAREVFERVKEHQARPEALKALNEILNISRLFHEGALNVSEDEQIFTDVEIKTLGSLVQETTVWLDESMREQDRTPRYQNPKLLVRSIQEKIVSLDREVKYLVNKARITPPKKRKVEEKVVENNETLQQNVSSEAEEAEEIDSEKEEETTPKPLELPSSGESDQTHSKPSPTVGDSHTEL
ncbi:hypoxia up-regulated Grp170 co-chaperone protein [Brevipalpus obovatus]|uniref:hypoxia up-regulated Grp170 co-chaperone protein n=1 Tax=Brevipalpus obovatus TaxID=246614 RepID=UPI003D9E125F